LRANRLIPSLCGILCLTLGACDKDPSITSPSFAATCPTGLLDVNTPIAVTFSLPVSATTVSSSSIVVTDSTGLPVAGGLRTTSNGTVVEFVPSSTLPFGARLRLRLQNLLAEGTNTPLPVTVCVLQTIAPPLQLVWTGLPQATGSPLSGAALVKPDTGFIASSVVPVFRGGSGGFAVVFNSPYFSATFDVAFVDPLRGFGAHFEPRRLRSVVSQTLNGGLTFDTLGSIAGISLQKIFVRQGTSTGDTLFFSAGGGTTFSATFVKYNPATRAFATQTFGSTAAVGDIDFAADTVNGVAVTNGQPFLTPTPGRVYTTADGGATWTEVPSLVTPTGVVTYNGVAMRASGDIFVVGGRGYAIRVHPGGAIDTLLKDAVAIPDTTDYRTLFYSDVEFAPDNDQRGWIIGARQTGIVNGVPQYQGLIFQTDDGGATWVRQGVTGGPNFGSEFPRLNRISVLDQNHVWLVGDGGTVLQYAP
jgi:hypothetical protein